MLALWPSAYPSDTILNVLTLNGAPLAYNKNLGPGFGLCWQNNGWSVSANYVAANAADSSTGLFTGGSAGTSTVQLGYGKENWGLAAVYSYVQAGVGVPGATPFITREIEEGGVNSSSGGDLSTSQSWMVGLQWSDVLAKGNSVGMGLGQLSDAISVTPAVFT